MNDDTSDLRTRLADKWKFNWPVLSVLIAGDSSIDLPSLSVKSTEDAARFLRTYGFDPEVPGDLRLMHAVMVEAIGFIERNLMPKEWGQGIQSPDEVISCTDPCQLLVWASDREEAQKNRRLWSCAVLRVMHTIGHIEGAFRYKSIDQARDQIMARFNQFLTRDESGHVWLGTPQEKIRLARIDWKYSKPRESILLKLLHKRANVAETIYDVIGVRIVTEKQSDAMIAVKYLSKLHIVSYPNCNPSRARNTLLDSDAFRKALDDLRGKLMSNLITPEQFEKSVATLNLSPPPSSSTNPHSATNYRSIQMTGRQLIKTDNPNFGWLQKLEREVGDLPADKAKLVGEVIQYIKSWHGAQGEIETTAFFPFEIQVMDAASYALNSSGPAAHGRYKRKQIRAARRRVLGDILQLG